MTAPAMTDRKFGFVFAIALAILAGMLWLLFGTVFRGLLFTAAAFAILAAVVPGILLPANRLWMAFAHRIGTLNNHLILGFIFILVITPAAVFIRLIGRDLMKRGFEPEAMSYLTAVSRQTDAETMGDIF